MALLSYYVRLQVQARLQETGFTTQKNCRCASKDTLCSEAVGVRMKKNAKPRVVCEGVAKDQSAARKCQAGQSLPCGAGVGEPKPIQSPASMGRTKAFPVPA